MTTPSQIDYRVELDTYNGPLDLLLYLVKRDEIDLHDIPIARLTEQYLKHLELLKQIDIDMAGEFLVMAATLLEIKSAMLAPPGTPGSPEQGDAAGIIAGEATTSGSDPRYELVQQLLAYKRFKDAANELEDRFEDWQSRFAHAPARDTGPQTDVSDEPEDAAPLDLDIEDVHVMDLCEAFARILASVGQGPARHEVVYDDTPIALHAEDIVDRLTREGSMSLQQIFVGRRSRAEMIGLFLATLELTRQRKVRVVQDAPGSEIRLELRPKEEWGAFNEPPAGTADAAVEKSADWRDPQTGEPQYDWPSEEARQRAERRAKLRVTRFQNKQNAGEAAEDDAPFNVSNNSDDSNDRDDDKSSDA